MVGELRTLTSHAGLLPHHSSGEEDSDGPTARFSRSRFIRKIVREQQGLVLRTLFNKLTRFDGIGCITVEEEVEVAMGRIDRFLGTYEIEPQNRRIGKRCNRAA